MLVKQLTGNSCRLLVCTVLIELDGKNTVEFERKAKCGIVSFPFYVDFLKEEDCDVFVYVNHQVTNKSTGKNVFHHCCLDQDSELRWADLEVELKTGQE